MASYPSSVVALSTKNDGDTVFSSHVDALQDEIIAVENGLLSGIAHNFLPDADVTRQFGTSAKRWLHPSGAVGAPGVPVGATNVGMYSSGTNALDFATTGAKALGIDSTQFVDSPTQPRAAVYRGATQSITTGTDTALIFDNEDYDVGAMHDNVTNNTRLTVPTGGDGMYLVNVNVFFALNAAGVRIVKLLKNGATELTRQQITAADANEKYVGFAHQVTLAAADYIEVVVNQTSGGNLNVGSATRALSNQAQIVKLW